MSLTIKMGHLNVNHSLNLNHYVDLNSLYAGMAETHLMGLLETFELVYWHKCIKDINVDPNVKIIQQSLDKIEIVIEKGESYIIYRAYHRDGRIYTWIEP